MRARSEKVEVVLLDCHVSSRELLARELSRGRSFSVAGISGTGAEGLELCRRAKPGLVVVVDLLLGPGLSGIEVIRRLRRLRLTPRILIYTAVESRELIVEALRERPDGFVRRHDPLATLHEALRVVSQGGSYFTELAASQLEAPTRRGRPPLLTPRELSVLQLIAAGRRTKEIASQLDISLKTAEHHRANLMDKLGIREVASLTRYAISHGYIDVAAAR